MKNILPFSILGISFVLGLFFVGDAIQNRNKEQDRIFVTGLGKQDFSSDLIVWSGSFTRLNDEIGLAFDLLKKDQEKIKAYLISAGVPTNEIVFSSVDITKEYDYFYDQNGQSRNVFKGHRLNQRITIESKEVEKIEKISREITELINQDIEVYSYNPEYYYTQLAALKIEMIASATKDATDRARQIAENADAKLGELKSAKMGVFQIIAQNSSEDFSWGGSYNTFSKQKTATITMRLEFGIN